MITTVETVPSVPISWKSLDFLFGDVINEKDIETPTSTASSISSFRENLPFVVRQTGTDFEFFYIEHSNSQE